MTEPLNKTIRCLSSAKVTVACLLLMIIVVIWGTLYEASAGLFAARERFFQSWFILSSFNFPLPGIKLISLLLILNSIPSFFRFFRNPFKNSGILLIHLGVVLLLFGALFSSQFTREYYLPVKVGESVTCAYSYELSEIAIYKQLKDGYYTSDSIRVQNLKINQVISFPNAGIKFKVKDIRKQNDSEEIEKKPTYQISLWLDEFCSFHSGKEIDLKIGDMPLELQCNMETVYISLRPVAVPLPIRLHLRDFSEKYHPGTGTLKEVNSRILIKNGNFDREVVVSMNKPLQYGSYTFYQASFSQQGDRKISNFSVVYNPHRIFPHIASMIIIGGFLLHLLILILKKIVETKLEYSHNAK